MIEPAPGILLIADPFLKDPNFMRTVCIICEHKAEGSFGLVLNQKADLTLDELIENIDDSSIPVFYGGPVEVNTLHILHQYGDEIPGSHEIMKGVFWGGSFEAILEKLKSKTLDINKIRFYLGYSGWGEGQLDEEMKQRTWLTVGATQRLIFNNKPSDVWKNSLKQLGGEYEMMANFPIDPQLN
ncbi:MAG: YqgE/AlgH family protein [Bacteroidetes bacterium]|nr:YqgE/AlgH family protein [Bacteroidota bacterium]